MLLAPVLAGFCFNYFPFRYPREDVRSGMKKEMELEDGKINLDES